MKASGANRQPQSVADITVADITVADITVADSGDGNGNGGGDRNRDTAGPLSAARLEQALGLVFRDRGLLLQALTHRSWVNDRGGDYLESYQRLEFLGDAVGRLIICDVLYRRLPAQDEGELSARLRALTSQEGQAAVAQRLGLADYIRLGTGFDAAGGRHSAAALGDVMEAVIAAVYLDGGYDAARRFVLSAMSAEIEAVCRPGWRADNPKGDLQELLQAQGKPTPAYCVVEQAGPAHQPRFVVAATTPDGVLGKGEGASKNAAETAAARNALAALGGDGPVR